MLSKQQRLAVIAQAVNKLQNNKNKSIANEKQLDRLAGMIVESEYVKTTKRESDGLSELNFN
jgi:hypothetical protein